MIIARRISELDEALKELRIKNDIGFVPTMGALHAGHISLIERSVKENSTTVASVFVNPTQFNDKNDLKNYPRTESEDFKLLKEAGCDIVFAPSVEEVYPEEDTRAFSFGELETVMEGASRPGHFNGVAQVVSKLFCFVEPTRAYFGEKDFQQVAIIKRMCKDLGLKIDIVRCNIIRDVDGLALSSRNKLLTKEQRDLVPVIYMTLKASLKRSLCDTVEGTKKWVTEQIDSNDKLKVDYFEIVNSDTLKSVSSWDEADDIQGCIAVQVGNIRLIDNINFKQKHQQ